MSKYGIIRFSEWVLLYTALIFLFYTGINSAYDNMIATGYTEPDPPFAVETGDGYFSVSVFGSKFSLEAGQVREAYEFSKNLAFN